MNKKIGSLLLAASVWLNALAPTALYATVAITPRPQGLLGGSSRDLRGGGFSAQDLVGGASVAFRRPPRAAVSPTPAR